MKKISLAFLCVFLLLSFSACTGSTQGDSSFEHNSSSQSSESAIKDIADEDSVAEDNDAKRVLIAYFSRTGTTEKAAITIQELTGGDVFKIEVEEPYPDDYNETLEIAEQEYYDEARPALLENTTNIADYDVVFIGYPIWFDTSPMVISTFLETNDLSGKIVVPFCTSGSSSIQNSVTRIKEISPNAEVLDGLRITANVDIEVWLQELGILK